MTGYENARQLVQVLLKMEGSITPELIASKVDLILSMLHSTGAGSDIDRSALIRELESGFNVWIGPGSTLDDPTGHIRWLLPERKESIGWDFWRRYERYLEEDLGWAPRTVRRLEQLTDTVLSQLEDPMRPGPWDRRGMVVGQVQSGKTANYTGLICKAVDAGYKLIVVLTGMHNSLRSQTQLRLDQGFLGFDTQRNRVFDDENVNYRIGVGLIPVNKHLVAHSLTSSANLGDFNRRVADQVGVVPGGKDPILLVVKKNKSVLTNLYRWVKAIRSQTGENGRPIIRNVPLLLIDDEADNASINTNPVPVLTDGGVAEEYDIAAINRLIRTFINLFDECAYVGYTATPFANIFIYPEGESPSAGEDLFPRSFIVNLPAPTNYMGPAQVFGLGADDSIGIESHPSLPILRLVEDGDQWLPNGHKKDYTPGPLPGSLRRALLSFVLTIAARLARGQEHVHNSMLIHVTRFVAVQERVAELVDEELGDFQRRLRYGDGNLSMSLVEELRTLWSEDFQPTTEALSSMNVPYVQSCSAIEWDDLVVHLSAAARSIQVRRINGSAADALDYYDHKDGLSVIAVGGDKLSRGLTLEGLSVSYFLRASKMYDTLMQMGRWFGYRPGYTDLCRLYTSPELADWYRHIALASEELRREFDQMALVGGTPKDFGLKVRSHPAGLQITAVNKMRSGTVMRVSYEGTISETVAFETDAVIRARNFDALERLLTECARLSTYTERQGNPCWFDVPGDYVVEFLHDVVTHPDSRRANSGLLAQYVTAQMRHGELVRWTIVLVSNRNPRFRKRISGIDIGLTSREARNSDQGRDRHTIRRLVSPSDEAIDLSQPAVEEALKRTIDGWERSGGPESGRLKPTIPGGLAIRESRSSDRGLLLLYPLAEAAAGGGAPVVGFALSFPKSTTARAVEYRVNNTYWQQEFGGE